MAESMGRMRRVVFNDFPGHPIFADLSRAMAEQGNRVVHMYCSTMEAPRGDFVATETSRFQRIEIGEEFPRHEPLRRIRAEIQYGWRSAIEARRNEPDVMIANQMPVLSLLVVTLMTAHIPRVVWLQDIQSGLASITPLRSARLIARFLAPIERFVLRRAERVIVIDPAMLDAGVTNGVDPDRIAVQANWGPLDHIGLEPRRNDWGREHGLADRPVVMYAGTLGVKHDSDFLLGLAKRSRREGRKTAIVVVSMGPAWRRLQAAAKAEGLNNLICLPLQDYDVVPQMLATADVLVGTLIAGSERLAVPSKIGSYLCAGRPIAALVPPDSPVTALVNDLSGAGLATDKPRLLADFVLDVSEDSELGTKLGSLGREYAESNYDIDCIGAWLDTLVGEVVDGSKPALMLRWRGMLPRIVGNRYGEGQ